MHMHTVHIHIHIYIHTYLNACLHMYMPTYIHTWICIYLHECRYTCGNCSVMNNEKELVCCMEVEQLTWCLDDSNTECGSHCITSGILSLRLFASENFYLLCCCICVSLKDVLISASPVPLDETEFSMDSLEIAERRSNYISMKQTLSPWSIYPTVFVQW